MSATSLNRPLVIFDGDDTLWSTMPLYEAAKQLFASKVQGLVASAESAIGLLDEIDQANVASMGYSPRRFPSSLVQTYRRICSDNSVVCDPTVEDALRAAGESVFRTPAVTMDDAASSLTRLRGYCSLLLVTKGDAAIQEERVKESGLQSFFDSTIIIAEKTDIQFARILAEYDRAPAQAWSIGNSIRSDVNPALRVGMSAIWIPNLTWRHEEETMFRSNRLFTCYTLTEAAEIVIQESV